MTSASEGASRRRQVSSKGDKGRRIARVVSERIAEVTSPRLSGWDPAWELVASPSDRFIDALAVWERSGSADDLKAVELEAVALVAAWRKADQKYQEFLGAEAREVAVYG
jgi:hypothetical protein